MGFGGQVLRFAQVKDFGFSASVEHAEGGAHPFHTERAGIDEALAAEHAVEGRVRVTEHDDVGVDGAEAFQKGGLAVSLVEEVLPAGGRDMVDLDPKPCEEGANEAASLSGTCGPRRRTRATAVP